MDLNRNQNYDDLPKLQKEIVLCLANHGAMNITDTNKKLKKGHESATNLAFHKLEKKGKGMIQQVESYKYRGREFSKYWLSGRGLAYAFLHDANPETVSKNASLYMKDKTIEMYLKLRSLSHKIANLLDNHIFNEGKLDFKEMAEDLVYCVISDRLVLIQNISSEDFFSEIDTLKFLNTIKSSEEFYHEWKLTLEYMKRFLDQIEKINDAYAKKVEKIKEEIKEKFELLGE